MIATHKAKRTGVPWKRIVCVTLIILFINLKLTHFDRREYGVFSFAYVEHLFGPINFVPLLEWYVLYHVLSWLEDRVDRWMPIYLVPAAFFAFFMVEGRFFDTGANVDFFSTEKFFVALCCLAAIGYTAIYYIGFVVADYLLTRASEKIMQQSESRSFGRFGQALEAHPLVVSFLLLFLASLPLILLSYPGTFAGDCPRQFKQALGIQDLYYMHPVLHTLLLRLFFNLGNNVLGSQNLGIYVLCVIQSTAIVLAMAYCVKTLVNYVGVKGYAALLPPLVLFLNPRCHQFLVQLTKDGIFCAFLLGFIGASIRIIMGSKERHTYVLWLVFSLGTILFRREGLYLICPTLLLMALFRGCRIPAASVLVVVITFFMFWNRVALPMMKVVPGSPRVVYSIMFQQTARYLRDYPDDVTDEEREAIDVILPYDQLPELYESELSDPVIKSYNDESTSQDMQAYFDAWASMFLKHPDAYFRATLNNKYEYFYPSPTHSFWYTYQYSANYMGIVNKGCGTNFHYPSALDRPRIAYQNLRESFFHLPSMGLLVSSYLAVVSGAFLLFFGLRRRSWRELTIMMTLLMQLAVLAAGPTNGNYYRYTFPVVTVMPILMLLLVPVAAGRKTVVSQPVEESYESHIAANADVSDAVVASSKDDITADSGSTS